MLFAVMGATGVIAWYNQTTLHDAMLNHQGIFTEMELVSDIQLKLDKVLMPGNDYIITGDRRFIKEFEKVSNELEDRIKAVEAYLAGIRDEPDVVKEEKRILEDAKSAWENIRNISLRIFAIPNPVGNMDAVRLMEEMDYKWSYPTIEELEKWHKVDIKEYKEAMENMGKVWVRSWVIMAFAFVILTVLGISFAMFYSGLFVKPIKAIHNGADKIAMGNFKTRLDVQTGDEIEQLSKAMNEMAALLDNSYATLEQKVEERTRELKESEKRLYTITDTANDAIISMKSPDVIYIWNKKAEEMFDYPANEAVGREVHKLIVPEIYREKAHKGVQEFFKTGRGAVLGKVLELNAMRKDGTEFPVELSVSAMKIKGEWHATGVIRNITARKEAEKRLAEQMDFLERFHKAAVQREFRIKELKDKVKELEEEMKKAKEKPI